MDKLDAPDTHLLGFATGWLELGNAAEAKAELAKLSPSTAGHPDVLEVRWAIAATIADWKQALEVAQRLVETEPRRASGWLHRAYAIRRVEGGGLQSAWDALLPAAVKFPEEPTVPYNLACYACQLGQLEEARARLMSARAIGGKSEIRKMALKDEDLKPLWAEVSEW